MEVKKSDKVSLVQHHPKLEVVSRTFMLNQTVAMR